MGVLLPTPPFRRVLRTFLLALGLSSIAFSSVWAQQTKTVLVEPPAPLLPAAAGPLTLQGTPVTGTQSPGDVGSAAPILTEDGLSRWESARYASSGTTSSVRAYRFSDRTGALAAFTYLRKPGAPALAGGVGAESAVDGDQVVVQSGVSVVIATTGLRGAQREAALRDIVHGLPKVGGRQGQAPLLPTMVPARELHVGSVRYALGPAGYAAMRGVLPAELIGFDKAAEAITADYAGHSGTGVLTMLLYPTPQVAGERGRAIEAHLNSPAATPEKGTGTVKLRREGPLVLLATGGFSPDEAQQLVEGIHLRMDVTLDKPVPPEFHAEVRKTASLLVSIAVFSGVVGLAAVLLGLFLGFGRAWIRVLMGKPAATEPEFLRLDLSGRRPRGPEAP